MKDGRERVFLDSNVALYLIGSDPRKATIAEDIFRSAAIHRIISTQVIAEFVNIARRKAKLSWDDIRRDAGHIRAMCEVEVITPDTLDGAIDLCDAHGFSWYDSLIIASALRSGALRLFSEDFQDGRVVEGMQVVNPFMV